jgi:hypothetical protein
VFVLRRPIKCIPSLVEQEAMAQFGSLRRIRGDSDIDLESTEKMSNLWLSSVSICINGHQGQ